MEGGGTLAVVYTCLQAAGHDYKKGDHITLFGEPLLPTQLHLLY